MPVPFSRLIFFSRFKMPSWIVTSRAVVGSSQIRSLGSEMMAAATMARWSIPPESSWGYLRYSASGSGSSASAMACKARARRSSALSLVWTTRASSTWGPIRITGSMEVMGS